MFEMFYASLFVFHFIIVAIFKELEGCGGQGAG
jgi:hypothetical protein